MRKIPIFYYNLHFILIRRNILATAMSNMAILFGTCEAKFTRSNEYCNVAHFVAV